MKIKTFHPFFSFLFFRSLFSNNRPKLKMKKTFHPFYFFSRYPGLLNFSRKSFPGLKFCLKNIRPHLPENKFFFAALFLSSQRIFLTPSSSANISSLESQKMNPFSKEEILEVSEKLSLVNFFSPCLEFFRVNIFSPSLLEKLLPQPSTLEGENKFLVFSMLRRTGHLITRAAGSPAPRGGGMNDPNNRTRVIVAGHHLDKNGNQINHMDPSGKPHPQVFGIKCANPECPRLICDWNVDPCAKKVFSDNEDANVVGNLSHTSFVQGRDSVPLADPDSFLVVADASIKVPAQEIALRNDLNTADKKNGNQEKYQIEAQEIDKL